MKKHRFTTGGPRKGDTLANLSFIEESNTYSKEDIDKLESILKKAYIKGDTIKIVINKKENKEADWVELKKTIEELNSPKVTIKIIE